MCVCSHSGQAPQQAYVPQVSYQSGTAAAASRPRPPDHAGGGWNGWDDDDGAGAETDWRSREAPPARSNAGSDSRVAAPGRKAVAAAAKPAGARRDPSVASPFCFLPTYDAPATHMMDCPPPDACLMTSSRCPGGKAGKPGGWAGWDAGDELPDEVRRRS